MKMKKLVSLLLTGCMILGLAACGNTPAKESEESKSSAPVASSEVPSSEEPEVVENPYEGTTLEVWGVKEADLDPSATKGKWWNAVVVALDEWGAQNGVTLEWKGAWNQNAFMAAVASGEKPDLIFSYALFPNTVNYGFSQPLSDEAYEKLAATVGAQYLDAMVSKGECYGVNLPTNGAYMTYYNKTLFEQYGVKTPKEYFLEGNWTWETFEQCMTEMTKDLDGDGENETYGMASQWVNRLAGEAVTENADGTLSSRLETEKWRDYAEIFYKGMNETGSIVAGTGNILSQLDNPRPTMMFLDFGTYDIENYFEPLANGDIIEVAPIPAHSTDTKAEIEVNSYCLVIPKASDNVDASVDAMNYVCECLLKFMSDCSLGAMDCEYEGIQGTTAASAAWVADHQVKLEARKGFAADPEYDAEYAATLQEYVDSAQLYIARYYSGIDIPGRGSGKFEALGTMPPASALAEMVPVFQGQIDTYNSMYVY